MSKTFRVFGLLDIASVVLLAVQYVPVLPHLFGHSLTPVNFGSLWFSYPLWIPQLILLPLLIASAIGSLRLRSYGIITYYIQFPLRFPALVFSFGFITYVDKWFVPLDVTRYTLALAIFGEFLRLTYSIQTHMRLHRHHKKSA